MDNIRFHHFGLAVTGFERAITFHKNLGYTIEDPIIDEIQNVRIIMCRSTKFPDVELITPINELSPVNNYLKKSSEIIYHVCYEVDSIKNDLKYIIAGCKSYCVSKPKPAILFNNRNVTFYYIIGVGLIEVLESTSQR